MSNFFFYATLSTMVAAAVVVPIAYNIDQAKQNQVNETIPCDDTANLCPTGLICNLIDGLCSKLNADCTSDSDCAHASNQSTLNCCSNKCVNLSNDISNCGLCSNMCISKISCSNGKCSCSSDSECPGVTCNAQGYCE